MRLSRRVFASLALSAVGACRDGGPSYDSATAIDTAAALDGAAALDSARDAPLVDGGVADAAVPPAFDAAIVSDASSLFEVATRAQAALVVAARRFGAYAAAHAAAVADPKQTGLFPTTTKADGTYAVSDGGDWASGFYPGCLFKLAAHFRAHPSTEAELPSAAQLSAWAALWTERLPAVPRDTHDLGFVIYGSYGQGLLLDGRASYAGHLTTAATALLTKRWRADLGIFAAADIADNGAGTPTIIDVLPNLELLLWAAEQPGADPNLRSNAVAHARAALLNQVRPAPFAFDAGAGRDGSTYQVVRYRRDAANALVVTPEKRQGYAVESTWSRGQAWAVYGFSMLYERTRQADFLAAARRTSAFFHDSLRARPGRDLVPPYDFDDPAPSRKDSSAAAIAAAGWLRLARVTPDSNEAASLRISAAELIDALLVPPYFDPNQNIESLLAKADYGGEKGASWGDYYFVEALAAITAGP